MRLRRDPQARDYVREHPLVIEERQALLLANGWQQAFAAPGPLHLEIGMGRGSFIAAAAAAHPDCQYIGLEKRAEPLSDALKRLPEPYPANLRLVNVDASLLAEMFAPGELSVIYLHFPDPWPKARHAKRRLTADAFLHQYQTILQPAGRLIFKTDGAAFYHWSCESFAQAGWRALKTSTNWPLGEHDTMSEYEMRYRKLGLPIYYAEFAPPVGDGFPDGLR